MKDNKPVPIQVAVVLSLVVILAGQWGCRRRSEEPAGPNNVSAESVPQPTIRPAGQGPGLDEVIAARKTWDVAFRAHVGKQAPDFTVTDLAGRTHILSSLKGRDVIVTIWATWCGPCRMEVPDLIELRKAVPEGELTILALSFVDPDNTEQMIRAFAEQNKINYVVAAVDKKALPEPYSAVSAIPSAFFIGKDGTLKLATIGVVPLADMMAILKARPANRL
ncbi:MAG: redoxin domain-containing protein [Sedimentisphaerales bacterium]|jgi:thiol-disulfide isomerase/thioredoxin|nr:redoxin domain-containing protein [Sedimentisphaerales bacterium]